MTERTKYEFVQERNELMNEKKEMRKIIEGEKNRDSWEEITAEMEKQKAEAASAHIEKLKGVYDNYVS